MKKFLFIIFFLFFSFSIKNNGFSQNPVTDSKFITYINWNLSNQGCFGCSSFYWSVVRTLSPDLNGYYYFYPYFYSNSFYVNGTWATTYVSDIFVYSDNLVIKQVSWVTFKESYSPVILWFKSKKQNPLIVIKWSQIKIL